jgi:hypothetical protein
VELPAGTALIGAMTIGQNRWMFRTKNLGKTKAPVNSYRVVTGLRLAMPSEVERCQRRNFYRVSTVGLTLPNVMCYPLLDPASAAVAEQANRVAIIDAIEGPRTPRLVRDTDDLTMPLVGPGLAAHLMNIGGGGAGLLFDDADGASLYAQRLYWLRVGLTPHIPLPLTVTARLRHTHIDSTHRIYAGMAFEFGFHPQHQKFVVDQLMRCVALVQRDQLKRTGEAA